MVPKSHVLGVSPHGCNSENSSCLRPHFHCLESGDFRGTTAFLCAHLLKPGREGAVLGGTAPVLRLMETLGFACVPPQWSYLHVRASLLQGTLSHPHKVQLWVASKCTVGLAAKSREPGLPCRVGTLPSSQHCSLCCLGILAQGSDDPLQMAGPSFYYILIPLC